MSTGLTFFSYSRADSAFVLKLAQDLRNAGANIWLDQLDIKAGSRWDASIEAALNASSTILIILSPTSVASNNVMDEVSFGLESNKTVIPVLLAQCTIPFRLKRLQHVDFTGEYQASLHQLFNQLGYTEAKAVEPPTAEANKEPPLTAVTQVFYSGQDKTTTGSFKLKKGKSWREENDGGIFPWNETSRGNNQIYLNDPGRYDCMLDLDSEEIKLSEDGGKSWFTQYFITEYK